MDNYNLDKEIKSFRVKEESLLTEINQKFAHLIDNSAEILVSNNCEHKDKLVLIDRLAIINKQIEFLNNNIEDLNSDILQNHIKELSEEQVNMIKDTRESRKLFNLFLPHMVLYQIIQQKN